MLSIVLRAPVLAFVSILVLALSACAPQMVSAPAPSSTLTPLTPTAKVAMLLPLTGKDARLGAAMQNAATLALTDLGTQSFDIIFADTGSSPAGAEAAARQVSGEKVGMVLGPIFADEVRAVRPTLGETPMIAFSTDTGVAGPGSYIMGVLPQDQADHIASYAVARGVRNALVVAPSDAFGQLMTHRFSLTMREHGRTITGPIWVTDDISNILSDISNIITSAQGRTIDAVFLPLPPDKANTVMESVKRLSGNRVPLILGTGLWDDVDLQAVPNLMNGFYGGPSPQSRARFEQSYTEEFKARPPRLAALAYDSVALAVTIHQAHGADGYTPINLTNPNGFAGINGLFRFRADGLNERALSILQMQPEGRAVVVPGNDRFGRVQR